MGLFVTGRGIDFSYCSTDKMEIMGELSIHIIFVTVHHVQIAYVKQETIINSKTLDTGVAKSTI